MASTGGTTNTGGTNSSSDVNSNLRGMLKHVTFDGKRSSWKEWKIKFGMVMSASGLMDFISGKDGNVPKQSELGNKLLFRAK